jgi:amino acid permease
MFCFSILTFLKKLDLVFKASPIAMVSLLISTFVIILSFPFNISNIDKGAIEPK